MFLRPLSAHLRLLSSVAAALLLAAAPARAQAGGAVELVVSDAETGAPLAGASVRVDGGAAGVSDSSGRVLLEGLPAGTHVIEVEMMGRRTMQPQVEVSTGQTLELEVLMDASAVELPEITAETQPDDGPGNAISRAFGRTRGTGILISRGQIERSRARRLSDLLGKVPGVRILYGSGGAVAMLQGGSGADPSSLGQRCVAEVYLDGVLLRTPSLDIVAIHELDAVEVYLHVVPPEYSGSNAGCGVIVLHTRTQ
ncbi:TonB-dependent receptor [Longimicrobium sp.]|uniref:TonB-dependent receptor n=1 Tax=Longimicrobium sp. TaxID=2029185 RepID=UPI002B579AD2|nr:TonB-dependent receptor [Longimicrobium sp.]HSU15804.1 TonB-dependent receptor [Longimicrobium sp.]